MAESDINSEEWLERGLAPDISCDRFSESGCIRESVLVPGEMTLAIYVNGVELVTILCTPAKLNSLVIGFLYSEGIIKSLKDIAGMRVCQEEGVADVKLNGTEFSPPPRRILTTGCGGGSIFNPKVKNVESDVRISSAEVFSLMKKLNRCSGLYRASGGIHTSALADTENLLIVAEDIGRHNTLDRIQGECLLTNVPTKDKLLLSTGRISSEMLIKAARMEIPVVISRSSPTDRSISLGSELGITVIGYARAGRFSVYSHSERIVAI